MLNPRLHFQPNEKASSFGFLFSMRTLAIIFLVITSLCFGQGRKDIRVVSENARSLTIEFVPSFATKILKDAEGQSFQTVAFSGEMAEELKPGEPVVPYRGVPLQFPSLRYSLSILASEYRIMDQVEPTPAPLPVSDKQFGLSPRYVRSQRTPVVRHDLAEIVDMVESAGKARATLRFFPVQYDVQSRNARMYTRLVIRLDFDAWPSPGLRASQPTVDVVQSNAGLLSTRQLRKTAGDSPLAQGTWYKMEVRETGIYRIDQAFLQRANISLSSIGAINSIRIFGDAGDMLPEDLSQPRPDGLEEIRRMVVDKNANGSFDTDDYVLFYARSTRGWKYDAVAKRFNHSFSYYSEPNYYFLTFGGAAGMSMDTVVSSNATGAYTPADFQEKLFLKQDRFNLISSGRLWVGQAFDILDKSAVYTNLLSGIVTAKPVEYRFAFLSRSSSIDTFSVFENGQLIGAPTLMYTVNVDASDNVGDYAYRSPQIVYRTTGSFPDSRSNVRVAFGTANQAAKGWIDYMDLLYRREFKAVGDFLQFVSPDTSATVEYVVRNLPTSEVFVFDVTDYRSVKQVTNVRTDDADGTVRRFQLAQIAGSVREVAVTGLAGTKTPTAVTKTGNSNIHGQSPGADFVVIAPAQFVAEGERLKAHRESHDSLKTVVVSIDNVYNEFSGGKLDPMAIRDFLRYAVQNWTLKPKYVLLLGNGHFDYKNIRTTAPNWIPPYESVESITQINSYASDDAFAMLDVGNPRISIPIGRIPARTAAEAATVVSKIIDYEMKAPLDVWRNRITFVADDGLTSTEDNGDMHVRQTEELANDHTPLSFERKKLYLSMYATVNSATGRRKPQANKEIVEAINRGTLITNFTGHGNPKLWTHEAVFTREESLPQLVNRDKLTFLVAATCNFAQYDLSTEQSAGELILVMEQGGAIGEVTASRAVFADQNSALNKEFYDNLFQPDAQGRPRRTGDAMWLTKQVMYGTNDVKYHLLGDPTMRLAAPRAIARLDSVNGNTTAQLATMKSLGQVSISGTIKKTDSTTWSGFNGRGMIEVFDSKRLMVLEDIGDYPVEVVGSVLYRGQVTVTGGAFRAVVPIPKDVTYGSRARLSLYAWNDASDAVGFTENVSISGTDTTVAIDTAGPRITIYLDDESFRSGDRVKPEALLIADLQDESGINTSTVGIGHRLEAVLNKSTAIDLSDFYRGNLDTYKSGQIRYPMSALPEGKYSLKLKAWDIRNNSSEAETFFEVSASTDVELANVFNFPNPFSGSTTFTFQRNSQEPVDVEVKIYTIAGRLIENLQVPSVADRFVQIPWNGRDRDGDPLANGVYFYKVVVKTLDRRSTKEEIGKLTIMR